MWPEILYDKTEFNTGITDSYTKCGLEDELNIKNQNDENELINSIS